MPLKTTIAAWCLLTVGCVPLADPGADPTGPNPTAGDLDPADPSVPDSDTDSGPLRPTGLVHAVGRFTDDPVPLSSWTLSSYETVVVGDSLSVQLTGAPDVWFEVVVDGVSEGKFATTGGDAEYPVVSGLGDAAEHRVGLFRRNEGYFGDVGFVGFVPGPGAELVESEFPYRHLVEFVGDSVTAGYGNEGDGPYCSFTADTENGYATYAAIAARELDAAAVLVAFSGKGVIQNYGGDRYDPMPVLYTRTLTFDPTGSWGFTGYAADAVVVNVGSNDFSAPLDEAEFVAGYVALLEQVRVHNPDAAIFAASWDGWPNVVPTAIDALGDPNVHLAEFRYENATGDGCDSHPDLAAHQRLGQDLAARMGEVLGW